MTRHMQRQKTGERGFVLVMALVFLMILTIIGLTAMSTTSLEEKMAGNSKEKNLAFQAAETGLLGAENWVTSLINKPVFPSTSTGLHVPSTTGVPIWDTISWSGANVVTYPCTPSVSSSCGSGLTKVATQPKFFVEDMGEVQETGGSLVLPGDYKGKGSTVLRITARGTGGTDVSQAMVQTTYLREF
jgi:type IV pilus assembly protein PilX